MFCKYFFPVWVMLLLSESCFSKSTCFEFGRSSFNHFLYFIVCALCNMFKKYLFHLVSQRFSPFIPFRNFDFSSCYLVSATFQVISCMCCEKKRASFSTFSSWEKNLFFFFFWEKQPSPLNYLSNFVKKIS